MREMSSYLVGLAAILALGLALLFTGPAMISDCSSSLTSPFWLVAVCATAFAALSVLAIWLHKPTAYLIVLATPLLVLGHDFQTQATLHGIVKLDCSTPRIR